MTSLGVNGGLIGKSRSPGPYNCSGMWTSGQQANAARGDQWPLLPNAISDLLLLYRGTNGETFIGSDSFTNQTITRTGGGYISNAYSKEGLTSYYSTTTSSRLKGDTSITYSGDFTWQCWWYPEFYQAGYKALFGVEGATDTWGLYINDDGNRPLFFAKTAPGFSMILDGSSGGAILLNQWNHVALTRSGSNLYLWFNGEIRAQTTYSTSVIGVPIVAAWFSGTGYLGYIDVTQMINGIALYTLNFTPPTVAFPDVDAGGDPYYATTSLLLHMGGTNGSTAFADSSATPKVITANGNAQISTAISKFGGTSAALDGTGDWLALTGNSGLVLGTGDFTIEMFVYFNAVGKRALYETAPVGSSGARSTGFVWYLNSASKLQVFSGGSDRGASIATFTTGTWYHIALVRSAGVFSYFIDGVKDATTFTLATNFTNNAPLIGRFCDNTADMLNGYIDELRVTKNIVRYTATFTPPTAAFPEAGTNAGDSKFAYNSLLLHMDGSNGSTTFTDNSLNALTVTANGNAQISTAQSKFGGASALFDGTGDYLTLADSSLWDFPADFTIEAWVKASATGFGPIVSFRDSGATVNPVLYLWNTGVFVWYYNSAARITGTTNIVGGNFYHVAVCRLSGSTRLFVNGVQEGVAYVNSDSYVADGVWIGAIPASSQYLNGYIDDLRITKDVARYTGAFTPSAAPYAG